MVLKVDFEADVQGLASVKRVTGTLLLKAKDVATARHYAEGYIESAYSNNYAILGCVPLDVIDLE